jgi:pyruvate kinase
VDIFRLNMAHGTRQQHQSAVDAIRRAGSAIGRPVGILVDLAGPKIRLGQLAVETLACVPGDFLTFVRGETATRTDQLVCSYAALLDELQVGDWIMLRDGLVRLAVREKGPDFARCQIVDGGEVRSRQGVNLPGVKLSIPAFGPADRDNADWAAKQEIDFVSLSFVRTAGELNELREALRARDSRALVVAKIEKREALDNLDSLIDSADAVMVARGDLGVEIDVEKTPLAQKRIIRACQAGGKPVIVATQMLESMHTSPQPTRAEVSDVANAILDGADACMLSGETAIGQYPRESVLMMRKVMREAEKLLEHRRSVESTFARDAGGAVDSAVIFGAAQIARRLEARAVVLATSSLRAARIKSKQRDFIPVVAVTPDKTVVRQLCLFWGVNPRLTDRLHQPTELRELIRRWTNEDPAFRSGDRVVVVADSEMFDDASDIVMVIAVEKSGS